jgi:hypothetical protein
MFRPVQIVAAGPPRSRASVSGPLIAALTNLQNFQHTAPRSWSPFPAIRKYRTAYDKKIKTFSDTPHRDWTTDIADAAIWRSLLVRLRHRLLPSLSSLRAFRCRDMTMDEFMDLEEDRGARRDRV